MELVAVIVGVLLLCLVLPLVWLAVRRVRLMRGGGVDLCLRRRFAVNDWHFGVGRFSGDEFAWYRLTSFRIGPTVVLDRSDLEIVDRRPPLRSEDFAIPSAVEVVRARNGVDGADVELAMSSDVLTGFMAWVEATPPGRGGYQRAS
ncbi:DUF2550 domain-containing protein [Pseudonocardia endophytica]|uniref:Uncharacterized protein DUF2550 n=1 Tax=Pseudonocardia endophytica TaxID=401976 RepID=A0A4R1HGA2_PSEEN|nr:DUF2550 domain-containing protein [Pseudonocardia endophytica]TCK20728.1 uncharacterized protein DUF2550 [Pseudonocardia endophytica]